MQNIREVCRAEIDKIYEVALANKEEAQEEYNEKTATLEKSVAKTNQLCETCRDAKSRFWTIVKALFKMIKRDPEADELEEVISPLNVYIKAKRSLPSAEKQEEADKNARDAAQKQLVKANSEFNGIACWKE